MTTHLMRTPVPPGIETPDEVHTRLGVLRFSHGFPDDATVATIFDNLDFQRAVQAYLLGLPAVSLAALRSALLELGPANTTVALWADLVHANTVALTMNTSTSYCISWIDLSDGPMVVEAPPGVLGILDDRWHRWVADLGLTGPDKGKGGRYLLLPPGWTGDVPDGYFVVRSPSYGNVLGWRGFRDESGDPHPAVEVIRAKSRIYPLAQADNPPQTRFVDVSHQPMVALAPRDHRFWELLDEVVRAEPPAASDPVTLGMIASIGIGHGKPFQPDTRTRRVLAEAAEVGDATARALAYRFPRDEAYRWPGSAWRSFFTAPYDFLDDGTALLDSAAQLYFIGFGVSPAEETRMLGKGSQYALAFLDASGAALTGAGSYRMHVPPDVPAAAFWSIMAYDTQTRSMLQSGQEWPSVTSQDPGFTTNPDGSVDVHFGPEQPGTAANWIQTPPDRGWFAVFRLYGPLQPWFDRSWRLPEIEPLA